MAPALFHWFDKVGETEEYNKKDTINSLKSLKDSIKNKLIIFHGDNDSTVPLKTSIELVKEVPNIELRILKGCTHRMNKVMLDSSLLEKSIEEIM